MAVKDTATLKGEAATLFTANGANAIAGDKQGTFIDDFLDSTTNKISDQPDLGTKIYRSGSISMNAGPNIVVTFTTAIGTINYKIFIDDPLGLRTGVFHDLTATGFEIDGTGAGNVDYVAFVNN